MLDKLTVLHGDNMTTEELQKKTICEACDKCQYDVLPNKKICTELENIIDVIVLHEEACPLEKW